MLEKEMIGILKNYREQLSNLDKRIINLTDIAESLSQANGHLNDRIATLESKVMFL